MSPRSDPLLPQRLSALDLQRRVEAALFPAVLAAVTIWLDAVRAIVLHQPPPPAATDLIAAPIRAAGNEPRPDIEDITAATRVWGRAVAEHVDPVLSEAFGEAFLDAARRADISPLPFQLEYLEQVHDRLKIWPEGAFEELRPELLEMLSEGMDYEQMTERIGRILDIDAPTRRIRAEISEIDRQIADEQTTAAERKMLRSRRRALWEQHDESLLEWQWKARRIARTETHGAIEGGAFAAACAVEAAGGQAMYKAWLATMDERVRGTHAVAEGQIVRLREPFRVGHAELQHPGEAGGPAHEVINCRCTTRYIRADEVQAELQGPRGGRGVAAGAARMGPDDVDEAAAALDRWRRLQRGETVEDPADQVVEDESEPPEPEPEPEPDPDPFPDDDPFPDNDPDNEHDDQEEEDLDDSPNDNEDDLGDDLTDDDLTDDESDSDTDDDPADLGDESDEDTDLDDSPEDELDDWDEFFADVDSSDPEPDEEDTDLEEHTGPILSPATRDQIARAQQSLPGDAAGWDAVTAPTEIRPQETRLERWMWENERNLDTMRDELAAVRADRRLAGLRDASSDDLWSEAYMRQRKQDELEAKLSRARSPRSIEKLTRDLEKVRSERELIERYMNLSLQVELATKSLQERRDNPPTESYWQQIEPPLTETRYPVDSLGKRLPPPELEAHLDSVMAVGAAMWHDIAAVMDRDPQLRVARSSGVRRDVARRESELVHSALAEVREFGGHQQRATADRKPGRARDPKDPVRKAPQMVFDDLRAAEEFFPRSWLEAADRRGELELGLVKRAYFSEKFGSNNRDLLCGNDPDSYMGDYDGAFSTYEREVMAHELGHRMEMAVPGLTALEFALVRRRAMVDGRLERPSEIYRGSGEYALADKWKRAYTGKTYDRPSDKDPAKIAHEAFQVGLQDLFGRSSMRFGDDDGGDLTMFMIALLVLL
ncbi:phage minor head protein [Nocardia sp. R16R-3T]